MLASTTGGSMFSYLDTPTVSPMSIVELMPGVYNLLEFAGVTSGERVLILTEHAVDTVVLQAITAGVAYRNAEVHVLSVGPFSPGGVDREVPSPLIGAIHAAADVVISLCWWSEVHSAQVFFSEVAKKGVRFVSLHMAATGASLATSARFPPELFYAIEERARELVDAAGEIRVTTADGTDLTMREITVSEGVGALAPGNWRPFPLGGINFYPAGADGVLTIADSTVTGVPEERLQVRLADGIVTAIEGGIAAEELRSYGPGGYYLRHALVGLNPKVRMAGGTQFEREKHAGAFYLGIDGLTDGVPSLAGPGHAHCDCQFDRPTVTLDGAPFIDGGRLLLLADPDIRKAAEQFGPADVLLDPNPRMVLPARYSRRP